MYDQGLAVDENDAVELVAQDDPPKRAALVKILSLAHIREMQQSMLPTTAANAGSHRRTSKAHGYLSTYFRRIVKPRQMDFE